MFSTFRELQSRHSLQSFLTSVMLKNKASFPSFTVASYLSMTGYSGLLRTKSIFAAVGFMEEGLCFKPRRFLNLRGLEITYITLNVLYGHNLLS